MSESQILPLEKFDVGCRGTDGIPGNEHMAAYKAIAVAGRPGYAKPTAQPLNEAAVLASMFGRHLDEEDIAPEAAAAAHGDAPVA